MAQDQPTPPPSRPGRPESWRMQRMVQRVPAHLGESTREVVSPWITVGGVILLIGVTCAVIFIMLGGTARLGALGLGATPTRTRAPTSVSPPLTVIPITLPLPTPTPGPTAATIKYKVKAGDTLTFIAEKYHVSIRAIMAANGMKDETIRIGEELIIPLPTPTPPGGASAPQLPLGSTPTPLSLESPPPSAEAAGTPGVIRYTVRGGDTLIGIAAANGSTVNAIRIANELDGDTIIAGQVLMVPVGAWTPSPVPTPTSNATSSPTSQFTYLAPNLKFPPDNYSFRGSKDVPVLEWLSPAILKLNEFYVVHVDYVTSGTTKSYPITVKQGTSLNLAPTLYYPGPNPNGTRYSWYVVIVSQPPGSQPLAQSPLSATRTFVWY